MCATNLSESEIDINKAMDGHLEVVRLLLSESEIDINKKFKSQTPLAIAKEKGHSEIVKLLEKHN